MLSFQNLVEHGGNTVYGGIMSDSDDEEFKEDDDGAVKGMELDGVERIQEEDLIDITTLTFPNPQPKIVYKGPVEDSFHFNKGVMSSDFPQLPPQVFNAMNGGGVMANELVSTQMAGYCFQPCLPMIVHGSPIVSLFCNTTPNIAPVLQDTFTSFMRSCYQLHQIRYACIKGLIPFHESMKKERLQQVVLECSQQLTLMESEQNAQLDALYSGKTRQEWDLNMFVMLLERYAIKYIHLLEYFLYTCLIEPYKCGIELEHVLTPTVVPTMQQVKFARREMILADVVKFFKHKHEVQGCTGIQYGLIEQLVKTEGTEKYKGYLPVQTLKEYMICMEDAASSSSNP